MDIEKLIEHLRECGTYGFKQEECREAALAIETLRAENRRLNEIICSIPTEPDSGRTIGQYDKEMSMCAYLDDLEAENKSIRADLARVTAERDALIKRTAGDCWSCIRRYECNSRKGPHSRCWEFDPRLLKED